MLAFTAHILPNTDLYDGDKLIPLGDPQFRELIVRSMQDWTEKVRPSVLIQHNENGRQYGRITDVYEAHDGIYVDGIITDPEVAQSMAEGGYRFVSPTIAWNFAADDHDPEIGNRWPAALLEVSLVSVPRHYTRQNDLQAYQAGLTQLSQENQHEDSYYLSDAAMVVAALSAALDKTKK